MPTLNFAVITKNDRNPAYTGAVQGIRRMAKRLGIGIDHSVPETPDSTVEQRALIEQAMAKRPDALILAPAHATALNRTLRAVEVAGIPLFCFVSKPENITPITYVGSDDFELAAEIARYLFDHCGGRGSFVIMEGHPDAITSKPRTDGFLAAVRDYPAVKIVATEAGYFQTAPARQAMESLLPSLNALDGVLAANDLMATGVIEALEAAGRDGVPVVGVNATPQGIAAIRAGKQLASSSFDAMKMGCVAVEAAFRYLSGERVPQEIILPVQLVDASNWQGWDKDYADRDLPIWEEVTRGMGQVRA